MLTHQIPDVDLCMAKKVFLGKTVHFSELNILSCIYCNADTMYSGFCGNIGMSP